MDLRRILPVLVALLLAGCDRDATDIGLATAPPLPAEFQGDWTFSESATIAYWEQSMSAEQIRTQREFRQALGSLGLPVGTDLRVARNAIIGRNALIEPRFDLIAWEKTGNVITGRAWHHEDRRDPGDMHEIGIKLQIVNNELWMDIGDETEEIALARFIYLRLPALK